MAETSSKLSLGAFRRYNADVDDVTIVQPYDVHSEGDGAGVPPWWRVLYVAPSIVIPLFGGKSPRVRGSVVTDPEAAAELRDLLRQSDEGTIAGPEFFRRAAHWLERLLRSHADAAAMDRHLPPIERARAYLKDRPTEPVTLREIGAIAGVTISHLVRSFSRTVGLPPKSYHARVRLARARRLLTEGKSATWVAYECGFADQSHLSRRFKECYGVTPGAFQVQYCGLHSSLAEVKSPAA